MLSIMFVGLLIGMQHALEADHVAAVSSLVSRQRGAGRIVRHGAWWGLGHGLTLTLVAGAAVLSGHAFSPGFSVWLEIAVGVMLVALGGQVCWRLVRDRVHFHMHRHGADQVHLHAHSHAGESPAAHGFDHRHGHPAGVPWRSLLVGMMHGLAGSAALIVLAASTLSDPWLGILYVALFGLGSMLGMVVLSALMALPMAWTARVLTITHRMLEGGIGVVTMGIGLWIVASGLAAT